MFKIMFSRFKNDRPKFTRRPAPDLLIINLYQCFFSGQENDDFGIRTSFISGASLLWIRVDVGLFVRNDSYDW